MMHKLSKENIILLHQKIIEQTGWLSIANGSMDEVGINNYDYAVSSERVIDDVRQQQ